MKTLLCMFVLTGLFCSSVGAYATNTAASHGASSYPVNLARVLPPGTANVDRLIGELPVSFEQNQGQLDRRIKFVSRGRGHAVSLTRDEALFSFFGKEAANASHPGGAGIRTPEPIQKKAVLRMKIKGANRGSRVEGLDEQRGKSNYFIGKNAKDWRTGIDRFAKVKYTEIYPGIDLVYHGKGQQLEYDFIVAPGADPNKIKLEFKGAETISLDKAGNLVLHTKAVNVIQNKPLIFQEIDGNRIVVAGKFVIKGKQVRFKVGEYDTSLDAKLQNVLRAYHAVNNRDRATACNVMGAFISEVQAQSGRSITAGQAAQLITAAKQVKVVLGCG